jgi:hypothetical protein
VKRADDFFLQIVLSTKHPKRKIFLSCKRAQKKSYSQLNSFFAGGTRDRTKEKKEKLFIKN